MAFVIIERYIAEASLLQSRMSRARIRVSAALTGRSALGSKMPSFPFCAIHFYANCWTIIGHQLEVIRDVGGFPEIGRALRPAKKLFARYNAVRNHYEHVDDRLPGRKNAGRLRIRHDFGNLIDTTLSLGGDRIDVGPASLRALRDVVRGVTRSYKQAAVAQLCQDDPKSFAHFVRLAETGTLVKRISRNAERFNANYDGA